MISMRGFRFAFAGVVIVCAFMSLTARAELQNVQVGGTLQFYGAWYSDFFEPNGTDVRIPDFFLPGRPIGPFGTESPIRADGTGNTVGFVEQRTRLHVAADFTDNVKAFIEIDSNDVWGEDFRSDYLTGQDAKTPTTEDLDVFQAYIEANELGGLPLRLRIGRQEMAYGAEWLVGTNPDPDPLTGLSFDAVRLTYGSEHLMVDAWWSKLADTSPLEQDGDVDFYGIYATYTAVPNISFDAYWMFIRDARSLNDTNLSPLAEWGENLLGWDNYDVSNLHTVGLRASGKYIGIDWDAEAAYQFGSADAVGALFKPFTYGDDRARWSNWAGRLELGYTFDASYQPRVYLAGAYYGGDDKRSLRFRQWLNPFDRSRASVSFNRLFSNYEQDALIDGSWLSDMWVVRGGVQITATEQLELGLDLAYEEALDSFARPVSFSVGHWRVPIAPTLAFWDQEGAKDLGWQLTSFATYAYSEDLSFELGWTHFFVGQGVKDGAFVDLNGLGLIAGRGSDDVDYLYFLTTIEF